MEVREKKIICQVISAQDNLISIVLVGFVKQSMTKIRKNPICLKENWTFADLCYRSQETKDSIIFEHEKLYF